MTQEKTVSEAVNHRRSVRIFNSEKLLDTTKVKQCLEQAALAPNSSNLQLWEFYHITSKDKITQISHYCFDQNAAKTAQQLIVVVVRKDLWRKRCKANLDFIDKTYKNVSDERMLKRKKGITTYYGKLIPFAYFDFLGIFGLLKYLLVLIMGLFRPMYREVRNSDMRIVAHKSAGLAAQTFMLSMAAIGYDTCPMEGSDTWRVKRLLGLPLGAEVNMIIGCGVRTEKGIYGERFRVPFQEIYKQI